MKKGWKFLCCIVTSIVLVFNTALIPAVNVQATQFAALGLYELLQGLLLSAGLKTSGLTNITDMQLNEAAYDALVLTVFKNNPTLAKYLTQAGELDQDATFRAELEAAEEGTEFDYGEFKISKDASGTNRIYASRTLVQEAAKALKSWAGTADNTFTKSGIEALENSAYGTVQYDNFVGIRTNSIKDISTYYSSVVTDKLAELGVNDSNSMVITIPTIVDNLKKLGCAISVEDYLYDSDVNVFYVVPFGYSFLIQGMSYFDYLSEYSTQGQVYKTEELVNFPFKINGLEGNLIDDYYLLNRANGIQMILHYPLYDECEVCTINFSDYSGIFPFYSCSAVFNFSNAVKNGSMVVSKINGQGNFSIWAQKLEITSSYISSGSDTKYANTDDYVSMEFDATTAETLAGYGSLADYVAYTTSLSKQLSDIKDAIEDSTEQNAAQTKEIVASINAQTNALSGGISDVITSVKVQTDAISDVLEATRLQTDAIGDVITGIDETIAAIKDISMTLPSDLTLTIPEEMMNITVQVPDISTEVINQIEVTHDYVALQDVITKSVSGVMADVFVPSEAAVDMTIHNFNNKFGFIDDMKTNIENMQSVIFGIKPSPILKIPIMKPNSKYNYGLGNYIIIDVSWYAAYKKYGDTLILAFLWLVFIWRIFIKLPGIINGTSADIVSMSNAVDRYNKSIEGKKGGK